MVALAGDQNGIEHPAAQHRPLDRPRWTPGRNHLLDAFQLLSRTEGIIPALESAHALAWIAREAGTTIPEGSTILVNLSGRGDKDVAQVRDILRAR